MAKIYSSRVMLDPQLISLANTALNNRIRDDREARKGLFDSFSNLGNTLGKFGDTMYERYLQGKRRDDVMGTATADQTKDPVFRAAVDEYARTGSSSPLSTYQLGVNTAAERASTTERATQDRKDRQDRDDYTKLLAAKDKYSATLKEMLDYDNPDSDKYSPAMANVKAQELKSLEEEFGTEAFATRAKDARAAAALERQERAVKKRIEADEKARAAAAAAQKKKEVEAKARRSDDTKYWILQNIMPVGSVKPEGYKSKKEGKWHQTKSAEEVRGEIADFINRNPDLDHDDRTELLDKLFGIKTQAELNQGAVDNANADHTHKKTVDALEDAVNKKTASSYAGKKLNSLEWKKIPEDVKKFLNRDGAGNVTLKE